MDMHLWTKHLSLGTHICNLGYIYARAKDPDLLLEIINLKDYGFNCSGYMIRLYTTILCMHGIAL